MSEQSSAWITSLNKRKRHHPSYNIMIREAILTEGGPQGCTRQAIFKYITNNFDVAHTDATEVRRCLRMAIVRGLKRGVLINSSGSGARGSFVLADDIIKKSNAVSGDANSATRKRSGNKIAKYLNAKDIVNDKENKRISCQDNDPKSRILKSYYEKQLNQKDAIIKVFQAMVDQSRRERHMVLAHLQAQDQALTNAWTEIKKLQTAINLLQKKMMEEPERVSIKDSAKMVEDPKSIWLHPATMELQRTGGIWSPVQVVSPDPYLPVWQWVGREVELELEA